MASHKYNYFDALAEMTDYAHQAARYFYSVIRDFNPLSLQKKIEELHEIEHAADEKRHEIMKHLVKEFLPPIEREDIIALASKIDDIVDCIDDMMQHFYLYNVQRLLPECADFSDLLLKCCESVQGISKNFSNFRKSSAILESIIQTNNLESEGDRLYATTMRRIFTAEMPDKEIIVWARIVTSFENCYDYCEEAAELFESTMMKNS